MSANVKVLSRAIRAKCLDCCGGIRNEVRDCRLKDCPLWPYRGAGAEVNAAGAVRPIPLKGKATVEAGLAGQMDIGDLFGEAMV